VTPYRNAPPVSEVLPVLPRPVPVIPLVERLRPENRLGEVLLFLAVVWALTVVATFLSR
jgi:hypothetical protein